MKCRNCKNLTHLYEDGEPYNWCEKVIDSPCLDLERDCKHYEAATRADKIRAMTDEELASFVAEQRYSVIKPIADCFSVDLTGAFDTCKTNALEWLQQKVEESAEHGN